MRRQEEMQLAEIIRNVVNGFDEIHRELVRLGANPVKLEIASQALRESEYALMAETSFSEKVHADSD